MITECVLWGMIILVGICGLMALFKKNIQSQLKLTETKFKTFSTWLIGAMFALTVTGIILALGINPKSVGFLVVLGGIFIWTLQNVRKGKEVNWWRIAVVLMIIGSGIYLFHGPIIKEGVIKEKPATLYEKAREKGYAKALLSEAKNQLWKSSPKPAPYVPSYQRIARGEFVGKGLSQDDKIKTGWMTPETVRKGDKIRFQFSKDTYIEVINSKGEKIRHEGPEQDLYFSSDFGQITFWASKGADVYVELWGMR